MSSSPVSGFREDEKALIPHRIVPDILLQQLVHRIELLLPQSKLPDDGLAVRPGMVVLGILSKALSSILQFLYAMQVMQSQLHLAIHDCIASVVAGTWSPC